MTLAAETPETGRRAGQLAGRLAVRATGAPWIAALVRPHAGRLALLLGLGLVAAAAGLLPPWLTAQVIDLGLIAGDGGALVFWSALLFAAGAAALALSVLTNTLHMRASVQMLADLRAALVDRLLAMAPATRARHRTGDLMARLDGDAGEVQAFAFNALLTGTGSGLRLIGGAAMLFWLEPRLAMLAIALAPAELAFLAWARPRTAARAEETRSAKGVLAAGLAELAQGLAQVQAAAGEAAARASVGRAQGDLNAALVRAQLWGEVTRGVPTLLSALMRSLVFLLGGLMVIRGELTLGALIAFLAYLGFLIGPLQALLGLWHARARLDAALDRLAPIMADDPAAPVWRDAPLPLPAGPGHLRLERLPGLGTHDIPPGTRLRVTGASGTGKTTLLSLLQRHAAPATGRILLDGADLRDLDRGALRRAVALVPQRPFLVRGTVAENLTLTAAATEAQMREVLALVGLDARLTPGTDLAEDGLTLSGGERQRLCLARALLAPFRVLILDEAVSEVDPATAGAIMTRISERFPGRTVIVATHGHETVLGPFDAEIAIGAPA